MKFQLICSLTQDPVPHRAGEGGEPVGAARSGNGRRSGEEDGVVGRDRDLHALGMRAATERRHHTGRLLLPVPRLPLRRGRPHTEGPGAY